MSEIKCLVGMVMSLVTNRRTEQLSKYIEDNRSQVSNYQRKELLIREE